MKKLLVFTLIFVIVATPFGVWHYFHAKGETVVVEIPMGATPVKIGELLKEKGVIKSKLWFRLCIKACGAGTMLRSGSFKLNQNTAVPEVIWRLITDSGAQLQKIVVPEGWRAEEIADELFRNGIISSTQPFIKQVRQEKLEGHLFPSTYLFSPYTPTRKIIKTMTAEYDKNVKSMIEEADRINDEKEIIILASIVEREAVEEDERPKIAAVYLNRLRIGKRLEADPTVQYAVGYDTNENRQWKKDLTLRDLRVDSPYNTYRYPGLPPAPICNPGINSVKAVLHPQPNFDALYFVAGTQPGRHIFSKTYNQHIQVIRSVRAAQN
jgi:conserved hypothetical protein, YceG family